MLAIRQRLRSFAKIDYFVYIIVLIYVVFLTYVTIIRYFAFDFCGWDLAVFDQSLWTTINYGIVNGQIFWNNLNFGHLHVHFDPILFLILPIYAIYQSPLTFLFLQAFFLGIGAIPLYWLARDEMESKTVSLLFAVMYLTYGPLTGIAWTFVPDSFLPAFLLFAFYYFQKGKWSRYFTFLILALMCKEIVPLVTVFLGFYGLWASRKSIIESKGKLTEMLRNKKALSSIVTIMLSTIWFTVALRVLSYYTSISPWASEAKESALLVWWSHFGKDISSIALGMIANPIKTYNVLVTNLSKSHMYVLTLFTPLAFVSLFSPSTLLICTPYTLWLLLSSNPIFLTLRLHYIAPILPFIFISAVYGTKYLSKFYVRLVPGIRLVIQVHVKRKLSLNSLKTIVVIMVILNTLTTSFPLEESERNWFHNEKSMAYYTMTLHRQALRQVIALIPPNASILTHMNIFPHVAHRLQVYPGWRADLPEIDYIIVDTTLDWSYQGPPGKYWKYEAVTGSKLPYLWSTGEYGVVTAVDGIWLWKKGLEQNVSLQVIVSPGGHGLMASFYDNTQFEGKPAFNSIFVELGPRPYHWSTRWETYNLLRLTPHANIQGPFSGIFSGYLYIPQTGNYSFESKSLGEIALFIDNRNIIANMKKLALKEADIDLPLNITDHSSSSIQLDEGFHKIVLWFISYRGEGSIWINWLPFWKESWEVLPGEFLYLKPK